MGARKISRYADSGIEVRRRLGWLGANPTQCRITHPVSLTLVPVLSTDTEIRQPERQRLHELGAIAREYLLAYDPDQRQTTVQPGYFWPDDSVAPANSG